MELAGPWMERVMYVLAFSKGNCLTYLISSLKQIMTFMEWIFSIPIWQLWKQIWVTHDFGGRFIRNWFLVGATWTGRTIFPEVGKDRQNAQRTNAFVSIFSLPLCFPCLLKSAWINQSVHSEQDSFAVIVSFAPRIPFHRWRPWGWESGYSCLVRAGPGLWAQLFPLCITALCKTHELSIAFHKASPQALLRLVFTTACWRYYFLLLYRWWNWNSKS